MSTTDRRVSNAARRRALRTIGVTVAAGAIGPAVRATRAQGPKLAPTPRDAEGPFCPRSFPADADADLTRVAGRPGVACGTPLLLAGRVVAITARGNLTVTSGSPWLPVGEATLLILESRIGLTTYLEPICGFGSGRYAVYFDMPAALVM